MSIEQITDYNTKNKNPFLVEIFREANITGILESSDNQFNELETAFFQILLEMWIDTAIGEQLDVLGIHLNIKRQGRPDDAYRTLLKAKVEINVSSGEPERLIGAVRSLYEITDIEYSGVYPAKVRIHSDTESLSLFILYFIVDNNGNNIITNTGDTIIAEVEDIETPQTLIQVIPSGVGLLFSDNLIFNTGEFVITDTGYELAVTTSVT